LVDIAARARDRVRFRAVTTKDLTGLHNLSGLRDDWRERETTQLGDGGGAELRQRTRA
jgi:hypothetical protein